MCSNVEREKKNRLSKKNVEEAKQQQQQKKNVIVQATQSADRWLACL